MRTHREAIVTSSGGTSSASTTKTVDGGWLLDRLEQLGRDRRGHEVELVEDQHLALAFDRREERGADDVVGLLRGDRRALLARHSRTSGWRPVEREPGGAVVATRARRREERGGERARRDSAPAARRTDEQVGVHRAHRGGTELRHRAVLSDHLGNRSGEMSETAGALTAPDVRAPRPAPRPPPRRSTPIRRSPPSRRGRRRPACGTRRRRARGSPRPAASKRSGAVDSRAAARSTGTSSSTVRSGSSPPVAHADRSAMRSGAMPRPYPW